MEGLGKDIYSDSQKAQHLALMRTLHARDPIFNSGVNQAVNSATYDSIGVLRLRPTLSDMDITNLHNLLLGYLFPWVPKIASLWHWVTGFLLAIALFKLVVGSALRVYIIYRQRGLGWWVVGALWGTLFNILRMPFTIVQAAVAAAVVPLDDHPNQGGHGGKGGAAAGVAILGMEAWVNGAKAFPPAYQVEPPRQAASHYAAARGPDLNQDLPYSDIRLPGAPRCHPHQGSSAPSFPRGGARDSIVPEMPPEMELLPRLPRLSTASDDDAKAEAAAAQATALRAAKLAKSCTASETRKPEESRQFRAHEGRRLRQVAPVEAETSMAGPEEEEQSRQAFIRFCTGGSRVEYE